MTTSQLFVLNDKLNSDRSHQCRSSKCVLWFRLLIICCPILFTTARADSEVTAISDLLEAGEYLIALIVLEDLKPLRPCDPDLLFLEARVYETAGETDRAIALYKNLIDVFPNFPEPYNNLASLYAALGEMSKAETLLLRGLATHTTYQQLHSNLGRIYVTRAAEAYRKALNIKTPSDSTSRKPPTTFLVDSETLLHSDKEASSEPPDKCNTSDASP